MDISSGEVKKLRELTGASVMECKKALAESARDFDRAQAVLKERGVEKAEKKSVRSTKAGLVEPYIHTDGRVGSLVELLCETDFVARNPVFKELAHNLAMQAVAVDPKTPEEFLASPFIKDDSQTVSELIVSKIAVLGENIKLGKFVRFQI